LQDVPGFMIGSKVEKQGIIRHGAKMIAAMAEATVPRLSVVLRKAYGAGLYAMSGPGFEPDIALALPQASIAVMGAEAAVNAVYFNKIAALPEAERPAYVKKLQDEYREQIDLRKIASDLSIDGVIPGDRLRAELIRRLSYMGTKSDQRPPKKHCVYPV
jgi:methylmalonyl-CoA decarboxylase subunit alpha